MVARCAACGRGRAYADARHLVERTGFSEPRHVRGFFSVCTSYPAAIHGNSIIKGEISNVGTFLGAVRLVAAP
jgi:hypothetical protein